MKNHSPPKAKPKLGEACTQPQPTKGKTKTGGSLCTTTAQKRQHQDLGEPENNHSPAKAKPRPREVYAKPQLSKGKR